MSVIASSVATAVTDRPSDRQMLCRSREQEGSRQDRAFSPAADAFTSEPEACEDAPLPAVIEALVLQRVLAQYACTSRACLGCAFLWSGITHESWAT